jgi:hypothetical protein
MKKAKNKIKVSRIIGNPDAPINEVVRHMRLSEMEIINGRLDKIRSIIALVFYMANGDLLGESSEGLTHVVDDTLIEFDELRRKINGETEEEEHERFRREREKKAA